MTENITHNISIISRFKCFLTDQISGQDFYAFVVSDIEDVEKYLLASNNLDLYLRLMETDYSSLFQRFFLRDHIAAYLSSIGVEYERHTQDDIDMALRSEEPNVMDLIPHEIYNLSHEAEMYLYEHIIENLPEGLSIDMQKKWLSTELKRHFPHYTPPVWIQCGGWPMGKDKPMSFMGQVDLPNCGYYHDETSLYVFFDPVADEYKVIKQSY